MALDMITIGNKVEIVESSVIRNGIVDDGTTPVLVSQVYEIVDDDHLKIEMPLRGTQLVLLDPRVRYHICIYSSYGLFRCNVQVIDRFKSENKYIALIELKSALKRLQRREFFRLEKLLEIEYRKLTDEEKKIESSNDIIDNEPLNVVYNSAIAVDLSGGGARLVMNERLFQNDMIMVRFKFADTKLAFAAIMVLSTQMKVDNTQYENRVKFIKLKEKEREKLIKYIFEEERKMRFKRKS